ncbi:BatD family protein [Prosthecochloris sp. N3]|uniref:BatD family protein n=1 Tax=Prosthecochloris ethylica TaxID=2743976 RepID=A0ABR9XPU7_9CHLB|nr:BatD family protein [Prosthecochloris ethylica]MBF0585905.1 BatD family protein [Prosthecochloris ethylica]MBF0635815.1 BatD family protein [Prosthecochloris ethylica]NUK47113.1 BatD family protein [Prosthecochloris ethylica]
MIRICCLLMTVIMAGTLHAADRAHHELFLEAEPSARTVYSGEAFRITCRLLFKNDAPKIIAEHEPRHAGLWLDSGPSERFMPVTPSTRGNREYNSAIIRQMTAVPLRNGNLTLSGYRIDLLVPDGAHNADTIRLRTPDITIEARPLPSPVPPSFSGAVGDIRIASVVPATDSISCGTPFSIDIRITGDASPHITPEPELTLPRGIRLMSSTGRRSGETIHWRFTLVADTTGTVVIPPSRLVYFNPSGKRYLTASSAPFELTLHPSRQQQGDLPSSNGVEQSISQAPSRHHLPVLPVILGTIIVIMVATGLLLARTQERHPAPAIPATGTSGTSLKEIRTGFEAALERLTGTHPQGMTQQELATALEKLGITERSRRKITALFERLDRAEFSPKAPGADERHHLADQISELTKQLSRERSRSSR